MMSARVPDPLEPILPPASIKDQIRLTYGLSGADLGLVLAGRCMAGGSIGLYETLGTDALGPDKTTINRSILIRQKVYSIWYRICGLWYVAHGI